MIDGVRARHADDGHSTDDGLSNQSAAAPHMFRGMPFDASDPLVPHPSKPPPPAKTAMKAPMKARMKAALWYCATLISRLFTIDKRALALFRMGYGVVLAIDILCNLPWVRFFLTDDGFYTRKYVIESTTHATSHFFSLYMISGQQELLSLLLLVHAACLLCFAVGYRTRLFSVLCWVLIASYQARLSVTLQAGDTVARVFLYIAMFLPVHERWSVDAWLARRKGKALTPHSPPSTGTLSMATVFVYAQLFIIYVSTGIFKSHRSWHTDLLANQMFSVLDLFGTPLGRYLMHFPTVNKFLTWFSWYAIERYLPYVLLFPFFLPVVRTIIGMSFIGFHIGIYMTAEIGIFPWVCIFAWVLVLPPWVWDRLEAMLGRAQRLFFSRRKLSAVLFPGVVAAAAIPMSYRHISLGAAVACALVVYPMAVAGCYLLQPLLVEYHTAMKLTMQRPMEDMHLSDMEDVELGAVHGKRRGKAVIPSRLHAAQGYAAYVKEVLATSFVNIMAIFSIWAIIECTLSEHKVMSMNGFPVRFMWYTRLGQRWDMFSPSVFQRDGWPLVVGHETDGGEINVFKGVVTLNGRFTDASELGVDYAKPSYVYGLFPYFRHRKLVTRVFLDGRMAPVRTNYLDYLCREYNGPIRRRHMVNGQMLSRVDALTLVYMEERTMFNETHVWEHSPTKRVLAKHKCAKGRELPVSSCTPEELTPFVANAVARNSRLSNNRAVALTADCASIWQTYSYSSLQAAAREAFDTCSKRFGSCFLYSLNGGRLRGKSIVLEDL